MSRLGAYLSAFLEQRFLNNISWQIILINILGIIRIIWNWYREREKSEVENISNLLLPQYDGKDRWYKTILLWITNVRFFTDRITIFACASNIVTIFAQSWRYLLIPWMLLKFIKGVLEVVIIVTMFLLGYEKNVPTMKFVEFIVEKFVWIVTYISYTWYITLKWYMQLQKAEKLRKLTIIARKSIADISEVPGRVGHSLDDELLAIAEARRGRYASTASLLNLDSLSMESHRANFELRVSKSLSTKISENSRESNNSNDSVSNDLSVAEKSMKMLNITAEDVMDARARIQERSSYWSERNISQKMSKAMEEVMEEVILERDKEEINNKLMKNEQVATDSRKKVTNSTSRKEVNMKNPLTEKEREKDDNKKTLVEKKKAKTTDTKSQCNQNAMLQRKELENSERAEKFVQCSSKNRRNMLSTSLVKKTKTKLDSNPASHEKWIDLNNQKKDSHDVKIRKLTPTDSSNDKKEKRYKDLRMSSCEFHRAMYTNSMLKNGNCIKSAADDKDVKDVKDDVDRKEAKRFVSCVNTQKEKLNGYSRLNYSEIYRLKKQIQKSSESCGKQLNTWGSKSLAETARPSGYAKHFVAADRSRFICQNAQTEVFDKSNDSSNVRSKMKQIERIENNRSIKLHSVYNMISLKRKNYVKSEEHEAGLLISDHNLALLKDKKDMKARKRRALSPKKLPIEKFDAIERTALRAYNKLTLLEDKRKLEAKKERDLNCEQSTKELNVSKRQVYEDLTLLQDKQEMETIKRHNLSPSCKQFNKESIASKFRDKLTFLADKKEEHGTPSNSEENIKVLIRTNHLPESNHKEIVNCSPLETHENANSFEENDRLTRRRHRLNLREITRNIEWTVHPEGIVLANKNLRSQVSNERLRERQRDIVDDNTASMLHSAFFFKPEIITRIFRRAQSTTNESFSTVALQRQDFCTNFVCRVNNEVIVQDQNTLFGLDLDQMMERNDGLGCSLFSNVDTDNDNADNNRVIGEESNRDLYAISIELEQIVPESIVANTENSGIESQEDILTASNLVQLNAFEEENVVINNSLFEFVTDILRNIDVEENILGCTLSEQLDDREMNNVIVDYDFRPEEFSTNDTISNEENNTKRERRSLLDQSANIDEIIDDLSKQVLDSSNDDCSDNNTSSVNSMGQNNPHKSLEDKYLSKTNFYFENKIYENNLFHKRSDNNATSQVSDNNNNNNNNNNNTLLNTSINKAEIIMFNHDFEKSSKLSFSHPSSFIESNNCRASIVRSSDKNLQKFTQFLNSKAMIENQNSRSTNSEANANSQFSTLENVKFATETRDVARSENKVTDFYKTNKVPTTGFFEMNLEQLKQDDSFYSTYEKDDKSETQILLKESSLMEEFSDDTIPPGMSSFL